MKANYFGEEDAAPYDEGAVPMGAINFVARVRGVLLSATEGETVVGHAAASSATPSIQTTSSSILIARDSVSPTGEDRSHLSVRYAICSGVASGASKRPLYAIWS